MTVLYLTEPGSTRAASSWTLVVRRSGQERAQVPALGLERVVVLAQSHLTSSAVALCAQEQVELVVVSHGARVMARLGASPGGSLPWPPSTAAPPMRDFAWTSRTPSFAARCATNGGCWGVRRQRLTQRSRRRARSSVAAAECAG